MVGPNLVSVSNIGDPMLAMQFAQHGVLLFETLLCLRVDGVGPTDFVHAFASSASVLDNANVVAASSAGASGRKNQLAAEIIGRIADQI